MDDQNTQAPKPRTAAETGNMELVDPWADEKSADPADEEARRRRIAATLGALQALAAGAGQMAGGRRGGGGGRGGSIPLGTGVGGVGGSGTGFQV